MCISMLICYPNGGPQQPQVMATDERFARKVFCGGDKAILMPVNCINFRTHGYISEGRQSVLHSRPDDIGLSRHDVRGAPRWWWWRRRGERRFVHEFRGQLGTAHRKGGRVSEYREGDLDIRGRWGIRSLGFPASTIESFLRKSWLSDVISKSLFSQQLGCICFSWYFLIVQQRKACGAREVTDRRGEKISSFQLFFACMAVERWA